jgi:hypothetical protein
LNKGGVYKLRDGIILLVYGKHINPGKEKILMHHCLRSRNVAVVMLASLILFMVPQQGFTQVLGSCGTPDEGKPATAVAVAALTNQPMPLPGQHAINFELPAVVDEDIKMVKLSDYSNKWRVVCFYPADFTFV